MADKIKLRRDTRDNWEAVNPILDEGELGVIIDRNVAKIGDGTHGFNDLQSIHGVPEYYLNVKDFGAKGDGSTDDTEAIQAAVDAVISPVVTPEGYSWYRGLYFPGETYRISQPINIFPTATFYAPWTWVIELKGSPQTHIIAGDASNPINAFNFFDPANPYSKEKIIIDNFIFETYGNGYAIYAPGQPPEHASNLWLELKNITVRGGENTIDLGGVADCYHENILLWPQVGYDGLTNGIQTTRAGNRFYNVTAMYINNAFYLPSKGLGDDTLYAENVFSQGCCYVLKFGTINFLECILHNVHRYSETPLSEANIIYTEPDTSIDYLGISNYIGEGTNNFKLNANINKVSLFNIYKNSRFGDDDFNVYYNPSKVLDIEKFGGNITLSGTLT